MLLPTTSCQWKDSGEACDVANQRLYIIDGLHERDMRWPAVLNGWIPLGMMEHLKHAERF
jgi:hypothetical protein